MTYSFTDRASYIAASTSWKADYRQLSADIRKLKVDFKTAQRANQLSEIEHLRRKIQDGGVQAREMVSIRHGMKEEAQEQYLAAHTATA